MLDAQTEQIPYCAVSDEEWLTAQRMARSKVQQILRDRPNDVEDCLQDAVVHALTGRPFEGRSRFTTWFTIVAIRTALMMRRKVQHRRTVYIEEVFNEELGFGVPDTRVGQDVAFSGAQAERELQRAIEQLGSPLLRSAVRGRLAGNSIAEMAEAENAPIGTVKARLWRARRELLLNNRLRAIANSYGGKCEHTHSSAQEA